MLAGWPASQSSNPRSARFFDAPADAAPSAQLITCRRLGASRSSMPFGERRIAPETARRAPDASRRDGSR
jgi:hypothetical protein